MKKNYFENLDAIRYIAAMMVFFSHTIGYFVSPSIKDHVYLQKFLNVFMNGDTGVSVFFVLSGFLITYLLIVEKKTFGKIHLGKFYLRRFFRIWPLYYLVIFFSFFIYPVTKTILNLEGTLDSNLLYHLVFLSNFDVIHLHNFGLDGELSQDITWSVSVEEQFYLFWPLLFLLPRKFWGFLISVVIAYSLFFHFQHVNNIILLHFHTFSAIGKLGIGAFTAYLIMIFPKIKSFFEKTNTYSHFFLIFLIFSVLFFQDELFSTSFTKPFFSFVTSILFSLFIASQALTKNESKLNLSKLKTFTNLGKITYGIYLLHPIATTITIVFFNRILKIKHDENLMLALISTFIMYLLTILFAKFSYKYYESYFLKIKSTFVQK